MRVGLAYCWHKGVWWLLGQGRALSVVRTKANSWTRSCIATSDWPRAIPPFQAAHLHLVMLTSSDWALFINYLLQQALWARRLPNPLSVSSPLNFPSLEADGLIWQLITPSVNKKESFVSPLFWKTPLLFFFVAYPVLLLYFLLLVSFCKKNHVFFLITIIRMVRSDQPALKHNRLF